jgi:hypothetical protein
LDVDHLRGEVRETEDLSKFTLAKEWQGIPYILNINESLEKPTYIIFI